MNSPLKAEEKIKRHAAIEMCALVEVGESDSTTTNNLILVAKKSEDYSEKPEDILIDEIMAYLHDAMRLQEIPKKIIFVDDFPLTSRGEIDKEALLGKWLL